MEIFTLSKKALAVLIRLIGSRMDAASMILILDELAFLDDEDRCAVLVGLIFLASPNNGNFVKELAERRK